MTNEVIWTKLVLERFIQLANLTEEEEIVIRTRAAGWSRVKQAMELNISISGIDRIISRLRKKYDEVQRLAPILPPRKRSVYGRNPKETREYSKKKTAVIRKGDCRLFFYNDFEKRDRRWRRVL